MHYLSRSLSYSRRRLARAVSPIQEPAAGKKSKPKNSCMVLCGAASLALHPERVSLRMTEAPSSPPRTSRTLGDGEGSCQGPFRAILGDPLCTSYRTGSTKDAMMPAKGTFGSLDQVKSKEGRGVQACHPIASGSPTPLPLRLSQPYELDQRTERWPPSDYVGQLRTVIWEPATIRFCIQALNCATLTYRACQGSPRVRRPRRSRAIGETSDQFAAAVCDWLVQVGDGYEVHR